MLYAKGKRYDYSINASQNAESFTQLIWRGSSDIGVGVAGNTNQKNEGDIYMIVVYNPNGNVIGQFTRNVFPPVQ